MPRKKGYAIDKVAKGSLLTFVKQTTTKHAEYRCVCGVNKVIQIYKVAIGETKSCGCLQKAIAKKDNTTHGLCGHPLWNKWRDIRNRCYNKKVKSFKDYGGRGVKMCDEWLNDFMSFYNWCINNGWSNGLQIDKDIIPNKKGLPALVYSPETCCFVTPKINSNNRRTSVFVKMKGAVKTVAEWSEEYSINQHLVSARLRRGWPLEQALTIDTKLTGKRKCLV